MQFKTLFLLAASFVAASAVAVPAPVPELSTEASAVAKLFTRDSELVKRDPCLSPCYNDCWQPSGCGISCWICCEINQYRADAC